MDLYRRFFVLVCSSTLTVFIQKKLLATKLFDVFFVGSIVAASIMTGLEKVNELRVYVLKLYFVVIFDILYLHMCRLLDEYVFLC